MSILGVVLLVATALALFIPLGRRLFERLPRWLDFVPAVLLALMLIQIAVEGLQAYMVIAYAVVLLLFLLTVRRMIRRDLPVKASRLRTVMTLVGAVLGIVALIGGILSGPMAASLAGEDLSHCPLTTSSFSCIMFLLNKKQEAGRYVSRANPSMPMSKLPTA